MSKNVFYTIFLLAFSINGNAQYKEYKISANGDTINVINQAGQKLGKWVTEMGELRGEPGYVEEGVYKKGVKDGFWRKYTIEGDLLAVEHYILGGKDGLQQYFTFVGSLEREESWKGYNPDAPYDTIAVYGTGSGEIVDYKIVKAEPYSVKDGEWRYYDPNSGQILYTVIWERNNIKKPTPPSVEEVPAETGKPKKIDKTGEMLEWERKNKGKKKVMRDGSTGT